MVDVLLVDDTRSFRLLYRRALNAAGFNVVEAESPDQAMKLIDEDPHRFAMVVSDFSMGAKNGDDLANAIRDQGLEMPFVLMSTNNHSELVTPGGAITDFWEKNADATGLLEKVRTHMGKHVVVLDDNAAYRDTLREVLQSKGYAVSTCATPAEAMQIVNAPLKTDLVISDFDLNAELTGIGVARELADKNVPFILHTNNEEFQLEQRDRGYRDEKAKGAIALYVKKGNIAAIRSAVDGVLSGAISTAPGGMTRKEG